MAWWTSRKRPTPRERKEFLELLLGERYPAVVLHLSVATDAELADYFAGCSILLKQLDQLGSDGREDMFGTLYTNRRISPALYLELKELPLETQRKVIALVEHF